MKEEDKGIEHSHLFMVCGAVILWAGVGLLDIPISYKVIAFGLVIALSGFIMKTIEIMKL